MVLILTLDGLAQTMFSALAKVIVRELRLTERTPVIVLYLGGVSGLGAAVACAALPGGFVLPTKAPQVSYLVGAGVSAISLAETPTEYHAVSQSHRCLWQ